MNRKRLEKEKTKNQKQKEEKQNMAHRNSVKKNGEPKVIELNLSATVAVIIAIVVLIVTVTSVKVITTIIEAEESRKLNNEEQNANERVTYVNSTLKDESGKIVNETDADGNVIQVPVPKGYSASKIEGETTASKGFVIYEGDVDWSTILVDDETNNDIEANTNSSDNIKDEENDMPLDEPAFDDDLVVINENMPEDNKKQDEEVAENVEINKNVVKQENINVAEEEVVSNENTENDDTTDGTPEQTVTQQEINIFNLQKTRNQYVWVPVDDPSRIYGVDSKGKIWGKLYNFSYTGRTAYNWTETNGIMNITSQTSYREPNVLQISSGYDRDGYSYMHSSVLGETRYEMLAQELEQNYYEIIESIKKYGGFYIGRYETGGLNGTAVVRKMDTNIGSQDWYTMYKKCLTLKGTNTDVKTSMIFGNLWDEALEWLVKSGATISDGTTLTYQLMKNSTTWGNYYNAKFNYIAANAETPLMTETKETKSTRIPAGSAEYTKANNVYDMAGNVWEWTTEANSTVVRVFRGGYCSYDGYYPASSRVNVSPDYSFGNYCYGCRSVLWIK